LRFFFGKATFGEMADSSPGPEPTLPPLSARIRRLRENRGLSRAQVCRLVEGLGEATLRAWEGGVTPGARWIPELSDALGVSCDDLLRGEVGEASS